MRIARPNGNPRPIGIYVHFPWCLKKCPYCDFSSVATGRSEVPNRDYADTVLAELHRRSRDLDEPVEIATLYFGGGTPSLWDPRELGRVVAGVRGAFATTDALEVTVEANPSSFSLSVASLLLDVGVNRISLGIQGLDDRRLSFLGRIHNAEQGLQAIQEALDAGIPRVSADLIFGLPEQSVDDAVKEASRLAQTGITHLSAYALTIEPRTPFGALAKKGKLPLAQEDQVAESFLAVDETLESLGFGHYEISSFAQPGYESRHNMGYWQGRDYLGIGCAAWGTVGVRQKKLRYRNTSSPSRYLAFGADWSHGDPWEVVGSGGKLAELEIIAAETALSERLLLGLRTAQGVDTALVAQELGVEVLTPQRSRIVNRLVQAGRLEQTGLRLSIPRNAWLLADGTIAELL